MIFTVETDIGDGTESIRNASIADLRQDTYDILSRVRRPTDKERTRLAELYPDQNPAFWTVEPTSARRLVIANPYYFGAVAYWDEVLWNYVPPEMEVALLNCLERDTWGQEPEDQFRRVAAFSIDVQGQLPTARAVILPSSALVQRDIQLTRTGKREHHFIRALEGLSPRRAFGAIAVGRWDEDNALAVMDVGHNTDPLGTFGGVRVIPGIVFVRE